MPYKCQRRLLMDGFLDRFDAAIAGFTAASFRGESGAPSRLSRRASRAVAAAAPPDRRVPTALTSIGHDGDEDELSSPHIMVLLFLTSVQELLLINEPTSTGRRIGSRPKTIAMKISAHIVAREFLRTIDRTKISLIRPAS